MDSNNKKKLDKLGIPFGTANAKLKKSLLFYMAILLKMDTCFHCGKIIQELEEFSIEHKIPWLNSDDPKKNFYDLDNIAFSHLKCNVEAGTKIPKQYESKRAKGIARYERLKEDEARYNHKLDVRNEWRRKKTLKEKQAQSNDGWTTQF